MTYTKVSKKLLPILCAVSVMVIVICIRFEADNRGKPLRKAYTIETSGCKIPFLNVEEEAITKELSVPDWKYICSRHSPVFGANGTTVWVDVNALEDNGADVKGLNCGYSPFWRRDPVARWDDDSEVVYGNRVEFHGSVRIKEEFVMVDCGKFVDFFSFVPRWIWWNYPERGERLKVMILGIDSLSRLHLRRTMPRTLKTLRDLGAVEMLGYNKVDDNSFPNLIPMLTGMSERDLTKACWTERWKKFDDCWDHFVYSVFERAGYLTGHAEESSYMGLFNYEKAGWWKQPFDLYWNVFEREAVRKTHYDYQADYPLCLGSRPSYSDLLEYNEKVATGSKESNRAYFLYSWITSLSHDNYNTASLGDSTISEHLLRLLHKGLLDDTVLIFMSDHGFRYGPIPNTNQGRLENRLPFMFLRLPRSLVERYPNYLENLNMNSRRLVTTYDVYATLLHVIEQPPKFDPRRYSLFAPIPESRTCGTAGIPSHYCTCFESVPVLTTEPIISRVVTFLLNHLNALLFGKPCHPLTLNSITLASLVTPGDVVLLSIRDYTVTFRTDPNNATLSGTVRITGKVLQLAGSVERLDAYENQSRCVTMKLKLYCYCL